MLVPVKGGRGDVEKVFPFLDELLETRVHVPSVDLGSIEGTKPRMLLNGRP